MNVLAAFNEPPPASGGGTTRAEWAQGLDPAWILANCSTRHAQSVIEQAVSYIVALQRERDHARLLLLQCADALAAAYDTVPRGGRKLTPPEAAALVKRAKQVLL